jgi:lipoprotein-releasing system permease protein
MYKALLCWRYLRTRYLAVACIVSVMLGVATLIVVNSVMAGFGAKLRERLHGMLSDVVIDGFTLDGFDDPAGKMERIRKDPFLGPRVVAMSPTVEIFAMLQCTLNDGRPVSRPVHVVGIDLKTRDSVGGFREHLKLQKDSANPSFDIPQAARIQAQNNDELLHVRQQIEMQRHVQPGDPPPPDPPIVKPRLPHGAIVGNLMATNRILEKKDGKTVSIEQTMLDPGDTIVLTTVSGQKMQPVYDRFVVCDYFKSEMSDYDSNYIFVELSHLQHLRTMEDRVTSIHIKLKDYDRDAKDVVDKLNMMFAGQPLRVETWEDKQGPLLAAIQIEKGILNVLLFLIVAVAGFGILAIFSMIVSEKTRDIGVLKALGASSGGIMQIFLGYGLLLGLVGSFLGTGAGIWLTTNINWVENKLAEGTGRHLFDPKIYYFSEIPTDIQPTAVMIVNFGALAIAVLFSILPAVRAARLHPVQALRYE